ncbi:hypothetical protein O0L34_g14961 [Tuta absoluta]|nr:hypothetical protein O0L34_g14961 [Tuta absoluta]
MDYYNFSPDFEDSLALLSPVAHRNTLLSNRVLIPEFIRAEDVHYMRSPITSQRNQKQLSRSHDQDKEIADQYCTESIRYRPNLHQKLTKPVLSIPKHRPLIKVIVTPNNQIGTQPNLRKRRPFAKKLHSSASDHESFFKAKNVFLFVASDKQEKVYEIKTTGSEYSTKHHSSVRYSEDEDIPVERNFKKLLSSLNMDKKKKKKGKPDKKKGKDNMAEGSATSLMDVMAGAENRKQSLLRDCMFSPPIETVSPQKSRVRISGKIGLTEDHRYVMKCDATVDGKPGN